MDKDFSNNDLTVLLERSSRFVIDWSEKGLILADVSQAAGPGSKRRYSYPAVLRAALGVHLKEKGFSLHAIRKILDGLWSIKPNFFFDWASGFLLSQERFAETLKSGSTGSPWGRKSEFKYGALVIFFMAGRELAFRTSGLALRDVMNSIPEMKEISSAEDLMIVDLTPIRSAVDERVKSL
jgi:hypothetical protein